MLLGYNFKPMPSPEARACEAIRLVVEAYSGL